LHLQSRIVVLAAEIDAVLSGWTEDGSAGDAPGSRGPRTSSQRDEDE
jgi:hypothetical protein